MSANTVRRVATRTLFASLAVAAAATITAGGASAAPVPSLPTVPLPVSPGHIEPYNPTLPNFSQIPGPVNPNTNYNLTLPDPAYYLPVIPFTGPGSPFCVNPNPAICPQ